MLRLIATACRTCAWLVLSASKYAKASKTDRKSKPEQRPHGLNGNAWLSHLVGGLRLLSRDGHGGRPWRRCKHVAYVQRAVPALPARWTRPRRWEDRSQRRDGSSHSLRCVKHGCDGSAAKGNHVAREPPAKPHTARGGILTQCHACIFDQMDLPVSAHLDNSCSREDNGQLSVSSANTQQETSHSELVCQRHLQPR